MPVTDSTATTLVLRFADIGIATYVSLRVVGEPGRLVTWMVAEDVLLAVTSALGEALPDPLAGEPLSDALTRSLASGPFATAEGERELAQLLGALRELLGERGDDGVENDDGIGHDART